MNDIYWEHGHAALLLADEHLTQRLCLRLLTLSIPRAHAVTTIREDTL
jgi:hypothetical protein